MIACRAIHFGACLLIFALLWCERLFAPLEIARAASLVRAFSRFRWWSLFAALVSGVGWLVLVAAQMEDDGAGAWPSWVTLRLVVIETRFGHLWSLRAGWAALLTVALWLPGSWTRLSAAAALLVSLAWAGHAGSMTGYGGAAHLGADALHLLAAGVWPAGLLPLALLLWSARHIQDQPRLMEMRTAVRRFSAMSIAAVSALTVTGLVESYFLIGTPASLLTTPYGRWLLVKLVSFGGMLVLGMQNWNQGRSEVSLGSGLPTLRQNMAWELLLGTAILVVVGVLGISAPPGHRM